MLQLPTALKVEWQYESTLCWQASALQSPQEPHLVSKADAQAEHDPADNKHSQVHSARLQRGSNYEQGSSDRHRPPPPKHPAQIDPVQALSPYNV